ncbi:hypothetical protein ASC90_08815 [Rhizobium sp. Root1220]|nr:hypothetical protein ASC90_08815 [Rhizobium sp. Root1220]
MDQHPAPTDNPDAVSDTYADPDHCDTDRVNLSLPRGLTNEVHEINLLIGAMLIGMHANYRWINRHSPELEAAKRTTTRLTKQAVELQALIARMENAAE